MDEPMAIVGQTKHREKSEGLRKEVSLEPRRHHGSRRSEVQVQRVAASNAETHRSRVR
jgi:hypothetical protein